MKVNPEDGVLIEKYLRGKEMEVEGVCDGESVVMGGIMEEIERGGVECGEWIAVYGGERLCEEMKGKMGE